MTSRVASAPGELQGRTAVITGASSGIGRATAIRMGASGAQCALFDINEVGLLETAGLIEAAGGQASCSVVDVAVEGEVADAIAAVIREFGRIDVLHNNAAALGPDTLGKDGDLLDTSVEIWERSLAVNLRGQMLMARSVVGAMKGHEGSIVNMSSAASLVGDASRLSYSVAKAGVNQLTRSIAVTYGKVGIRCNAVAAGLVLSPPAREQLTPELLEQFKRACLLPFIGVPEDIAEVVLFLASDRSRYITGQIISADGGMLVGRAPKQPSS